MERQNNKSFNIKKGNFIIPFIIISLFTVLGYSQIITIGGSGQDAGYSIIKTKDGGYAIAGSTTSFGQGGDDVYIIKTNNTGNLQWTRVIGSSGDERASSIIQTNDSSFLVVGYTYSFGQGNSDIYLIKLDTSGNVKWTKTIGTANSEIGYSIIQTSDGGFAIAGATYPPGQPQSNLYVVKLNAAGNMQWTRIIGGPDAENGTSIVETKDGGFIAFGTTNSFGQGDYDYYLVKLDASGSLLWSKAIGGNSIEQSANIIPTNDGGYILAGVTTSFGQGNYDAYLVKLDSTTNIQWTKTYGGPNTDGGMVIQTNDGGYFIAGITNSFGQGNYDMYLLKLNSSGDIIWTKTVGGVNYDIASYAVETSDGNLIVTGNTYSFGQGSNDIYIIQLTPGGYINTSGCGGISYGGAVDTGGTMITVSSSITSGGAMVTQTSGVDTGGVAQVCLPLSVKHKTTPPTMTVKWNTAEKTIILKLQEQKLDNPFSVEIFDTKGELITNKYYLSNNNSLKIHAENINSGIYIVRVITRDGKMFFSKVFIY